MSPNKGKRKSSKASRKAAAKKLLQDELFRKQDSLEKERAIIIDELSHLMKFNFSEEEKTEQLEKKLQQAKEDTVDACLYLDRAIAEYDADIEKFTILVSNTGNDIALLEKRIVAEKKETEEEQDRIRQKLLHSKELLETTLGHSIIYKLMQHDFMQDYISRDKTRLDICQHLEILEKSLENEIIVQKHNIQKEAETKLKEFLSVASGYFQTQIQKSMDEILKENMELNCQAEIDWRKWLKCEEPEAGFILNENYEEIDCTEIYKSIEKFEKMCSELITVRDLVEEEINCENEMKDVLPDTPIVIQNATIPEEMLLEHSTLKTLLEKIGEYTKLVKDSNEIINLKDYKEKALAIISMLNAGN